MFLKPVIYCFKNCDLLALLLFFYIYRLLLNVNITVTMKCLLCGALSLGL